MSYFTNHKNHYTTRPIIWEKTNPLPHNCILTYLSGCEFGVWVKLNGKAPFNAHAKSNVMHYPVATPDKIKSHPTKKNLDLFKDLILDNTNPDQVVFDPCCGSGTTIEACLCTNRKFLACELNKDYYDNATKYLEHNYSMLLAMQ